MTNSNNSRTTVSIDKQSLKKIAKDTVLISKLLNDLAKTVKPLVDELEKGKDKNEN